MIVKHEKTETLVIELDIPGLGPIQVRPSPNGGVSFCFKDGSWLWALPNDEGPGGFPPHLGFVKASMTGRSK